MENNKIFGLRPVLEAFKAGKTFEKIMIREGGVSDMLFQIVDLAGKNSVTLNRVPVERLNRLAKGGNHQGVVAFLSAAEYAGLEDVMEKIAQSEKLPFLLLLDRITDVRNFGAIARTAECAGIDAIVVAAKGAAPLNIDAMKTSAGALNHIPVCRVPNLRTAIYLLRSYDIKIVATSERSGKDYFSADLSGAVAIMLGSEESGISANNLELADETLRIPLCGNIDSLNVSAAAAVVSFECVRQRKQKRVAE
ncbi:MAG: 23S rRNA (guanosine(2251)-2'-O)-methyltransferase RlmB [Prevotellaceae bacterium]|jgi:23S rRNA (guanosine2251-2'-O)-methyltransferase|nr:23S rRNA (guanosine(2251)-2'-O)-methyltransferase RlmB [Prevotellaceae bacterium]